MVIISGSPYVPSRSVFVSEGRHLKYFRVSIGVWIGLRVKPVTLRFRAWRSSRSNFLTCPESLGCADFQKHSSGLQVSTKVV